MDPLTLGIGAVGLGMKVIGGFGAASAQSSAYALQQQEAQSEQQINVQKQQAFEIQTKRSQLENYRNVQRARAQGLNASVQGGAQYGSGVAGGQAQATDQGTFNNVGLGQNLLTSKNIFADNTAINQDKIGIAGYQSTAATDQGWANMGGALMAGAGTMSNIFGAGSASMSNSMPGSGGGMFFNNTPLKFGSP